jgi:capsular polysaccharide biosynthesis protein
MSTPVDPKALLRSQKIYERLLAAYPKSHRAEYGPAMAQLFRDQSRDAWREAQSWGITKLWLRVLPDLIKTSIVERLSTLNERKSMFDKIAALFRPYQVPRHTFRAVFVGVFLLVFGISVVTSFIMPETYASTARLKVAPDADNMFPGPSSSQPTAAYDPYFIQTTFEIMQDRVVLGPVIDKLNLNVIWGKKYFGGETLKTTETMELLKRRMSLNPVRNTKLIEITVYSEDKHEAAHLANAIAQSYQDYREKFHKEAAAKGIAVLQSQYQREEVQIPQLQLEVESLRQKCKIRFDASGPQSPQEQPYWDKKHDLEQMIEFHKLLGAKIEAEKLDIIIPKTSMAEITGQAQPGDMPVRPNKLLNIILGAIAGIFLASVAGALAAFIAFQLGKRMRKSPAPSAA